MLTITQQIILGIIQGITEWLPISSSAFVTLIFFNFYKITNLNEILHTTLFLHLGTFLAALIYFRKDVINLTKDLFKYKTAKLQQRKIINFLVISTIISGIIGIIILQTLNSFESALKLTGKTITLIIGILLLFTGIIQLKIKNKGLKNETEIKISDSVLLGFAQGLASLPGISRSGITISALMLKKFNDTTSLKLSFLMSLPIVFFGNLILNYKEFTLTNTALYGLLTSFVFGILTIHGLIKLSKKINFGWFVLIFATLTLFSLLI